jgi:hypothetical protein
MEKELVGIIVGGGPAPGINGVIGAATIDAINHGKKVVGIVGGFKSLFDGNKDAFMPLTIERVSRIHTTGGSILRTSRDRPVVSSMLSIRRKQLIMISLSPEDFLLSDTRQHDMLGSSWSVISWRMLAPWAGGILSLPWDVIPVIWHWV